jgi:hypothetical protein
MIALDEYSRGIGRVYSTTLYLALHSVDEGV